MRPNGEEMDSGWMEKVVSASSDFGGEMSL